MILKLTTQFITVLDNYHALWLLICRAHAVMSPAVQQAVQKLAAALHLHTGGKSLQQALDVGGLPISGCAVCYQPHIVLLFKPLIVQTAGALVK